MFPYWKPECTQTWSHTLKKNIKIARSFWFIVKMYFSPCQNCKMDSQDELLYDKVLCKTPQFCLFCYTSFKTEVYYGNSDTPKCSPGNWITVIKNHWGFTEISPLFHRMLFNVIGDYGSVIITNLRLLLLTPSFSSFELELRLLHYISKELYFSWLLFCWTA